MNYSADELFKDVWQPLLTVTTAAWAVWYSPKLAKDLLVAVQLEWTRLRKRSIPAVYNWE